MRKAVLFPIASLLMLLVIIGLLLLWDTPSVPPPQVTWGGPTLCVSERDYFTARMASLMGTWSAQISRDRSRSESAQENRYLVFDLVNRLIWLAEPGKRGTDDHVELPAAVSWKLYSRAEDGLEEMPSLLCLGPSRGWHGTLLLVGQTLTNTYFSCEMRGPFLNGSMNWEEGEFDSNARSSPSRAAVLSTILLTDAQRLAKVLETRPSLPLSEQTLSSAEAGLDPLAQRKAAWRRLEKPLYQALEQEATQCGYEVTRISVQPGPDYTAGLAGIGLNTSPSKPARQFWSFLLRRRRSFGMPFMFLTVDMQEDGRWRCQETQMGGGAGAPRRGGLDFYIEQAASTVDMDPIRPEPDQGTPQWHVDLDGTSVEMIGVCAHPGSTWWAPDGSGLDCWPGFWGNQTYNQVMHDVISSRSGQPIRMHTMSMGPMRDEQRIAVVLYVPSSIGFGNNSGASSSGSVSVHYGSRSPLLDRFGQPGRPQSPGQYIILQFDGSGQDSASHALGIGVGDVQTRPGRIRLGGGQAGVQAGISGGRVSGARISSDAMSQQEAGGDFPIQWVLLRNISLRPGQQTEFEMILAEDAGDIASTSRVQVRL